MSEIVSVVVPVYNAQRFLDRCVNSIVNQTYKNLEIILIDDGSLDDSVQMCDEWAKKDSRIKTLHKENQGAGETRNVGIDNATGKYLFFVDSDDYIDEKTIEKCIENAECYNSQAVLFSSSNVHSNGRIYHQKVSPLRNCFCDIEVKTELLPSLFTHTMGYGVSVWGKVFLTSIIKQNNIRFVSERQYYSEDALFVLEYFSKVSIASALSENLYFYYENENSLSRVYREDRQNKNEAFLLKALQIADDADLPDIVSIHIKARYHGCVMVKLKRIIQSDLKKTEKNRLLISEYNSEVLKSTLQRDVLKAEKKSLQLFFTFVKLRLYLMCYLLLLYKVNM